jgi:DeoR/GlpR family transcriptional regulator of sugar metabolism
LQSINRGAIARNMNFSDRHNDISCVVRNQGDAPVGNNACRLAGTLQAIRHDPSEPYQCGFLVRLDSGAVSASCVSSAGLVDRRHQFATQKFKRSTPMRVCDLSDIRMFASARQASNRFIGAYAASEVAMDAADGSGSFAVENEHG